MSVRKIEEKKYRVELYCVTWHAASESVYKGKKRLSYTDMDGDHCYFNRFFEYLEAGWDIFKMKDQLSVVLTGDIFPIEKHNVEKGVRMALARYIHQYLERWTDDEKIVDYPYIIDSKKVGKIVEDLLEILRQKPIEDFVVSLEDD